MSFEVSQTIPIFRIFDVSKAREFYVDYLGFQVDWIHRFEEATPVYLQVSRGGLRLHLSEHHGDCCPGSTVFVQIRGLEDFHRELAAKNYGYLSPGVEETFHGSRAMEVTDPFGNRIRFNEQKPPAPTL